MFCLLLQNVPMTHIAQKGGPKCMLSAEMESAKVTLISKVIILKYTNLKNESNYIKSICTNVSECTDIQHNCLSFLIPQTGCEHEGVRHLCSMSCNNCRGNLGQYLQSNYLYWHIFDKIIPIFHILPQICFCKWILLILVRNKTVPTVTAHALQQKLALAENTALLVVAEVKIRN